MKIKIDELNELVGTVLQKQGYSSEESKIITEVLMYAQLRGNNQGVVKLIGLGIPKSSDAGEVEIEKERNISAFFNAHQKQAMLVMHQVVDVAIRKAKEHGVGLVGIRGINTSSGALGFYAKKIADAGLVGIVCAGSMETVAAHGSSEAVFGTNPIAIGVPANGNPLVFDMTTAAMAFFGVVEAATAGQHLPGDIAFDKQGQPTTLPQDVLDDGALKSFDGSHKGSGLAMMVQALTGPLMGAYFTGFGDVVKNWGGHFILAFDPELFVGLEATQKGVTQMIEKVKSTRKLSGLEEIFVPGERGNRLTDQALSSGEIEIEDNLYAELNKAAGL
ncbi:MAG TPA: Ldh family oxidoreductase [Candidatus Paceibacterota bacterium]